MARRKETAEQLRARILSAMQSDIGISEHMAQPFVDSIMRCFAGEQPYFPAAERAYPVLQIAAALERGATVRQVLRDFELSRAKLYSLFPGGLPKARFAPLSTISMKVETK
ncbi:hypothetical protein BV378_14150 [Nostoc sp. RF31YmG]|jgi:Mor family transcriptional regulator|nr:hypothetical protein BV378_14150 [Nostoc sp. RF31YmG]